MPLLIKYTHIHEYFIPLLSSLIALIKKKKCFVEPKNVAKGRKEKKETDKHIKGKVIYFADLVGQVFGVNASTLDLARNRRQEA